MSKPSRHMARQAAIQALFEANDRVLDVEDVYHIGEQLSAG